MRISLITTVLNEEKSIESFMNSVVNQSKLPDEFIIVDGGSTDKTISIIDNYKSTISKFSFKFIKKKGNRSIGRNTAIKNSTGDVMVVTDAGCVLDKNWILNIVCFLEDKKVDVVAGYYKPITHSVFEKSLATYTCVMPDRINPTDFLPSSRSIAFRKEAWKKTRGYPEELNTCEDLVFAKNLKNFGFQFRFARNAIVYWPQRENILQAFKQFLGYAIGDGQAFYIRPQVPFLFGRYIMGIILLIIYLTTRLNTYIYIISLLLLLYCIWSIYKNYKYVKHPLALIYLPTLQLTSDIAVMIGMSIGLFRRYSPMI